MYNICLIGALADIANNHIQAISNNQFFHLKSVCDLETKKLQVGFPELSKEYIFIEYKKAIPTSSV